MELILWVFGISFVVMLDNACGFGQNNIKCIH
jgi:hypothetical protein